MKNVTLLVLVLLVGQFSYGWSLFGLGSSADLVNAKDYCAKLVSTDREPCNQFIQGKKFRSDFLDVCAEMKKKMYPAEPKECLEAIEGKISPAASSEQAEICDELIASKKKEFVMNCLQVNATKEFAEFCSRYIEKGKDYQSTVNCLNQVNNVANDEVDWKHISGGCKAIKEKGFGEATSTCLINAEAKRSDMTGGQSKMQNQRPATQNQR